MGYLNTHVYLRSSLITTAPPFVWSSRRGSRTMRQMQFSINARMRNTDSPAFGLARVRCAREGKLMSNLAVCFAVCLLRKEPYVSQNLPLRSLLPLSCLLPSFLSYIPVYLCFIHLSAHTSLLMPCLFTMHEYLTGLFLRYCHMLLFPPLAIQYCSHLMHYLSAFRSSAYLNISCFEPRMSVNLRR